MPYKDKAKEKAYHSAYYKTHKAEIAAQQAAYNAAHKSERAAYRAAHRSERNTYSVKWNAEHPEYFSAHHANKRAKKLGIPGLITVKQLRELYKACGGRCLCCNKKRRLTPDHIIPFSKKGCTNTIENIQSLCRSCNNKKRNSTTDFRITVERKAA